MAEGPKPASSNQLEKLCAHRSDFIAGLIVGLGLLVRLRAASGTFLNPDEALHFSVANQPSLALAYRASLAMAHPPLMILLLYWWRHLGTSELMLRLPSVIAGTAFCWIFYRWLKELFGPAVGLTGLVFVAFLPCMVMLSAEIRQYELMLLFLMAAALCLELGLSKNSAGWIVLSSLCLYLGILSHYSAFLFAATLAVYTLLRLLRYRAAASVIFCWAAGQLGAAALAAFLYVSQISKVKGTILAAQAFQLWLHKSYFHPGQEHVWTFVAARTFSVFQYLLGQLIIGDVACLLFIVSIAWLPGGLLPQGRGPNPLQVRCLLVLPFALTCLAALAGFYPYGGTRHCIFLIIFAVTGLALILTGIVGGRVLPGIGVAAVVVLLVYAYRTTYTIDLARVDQSQTQMEKAVTFVRERIPTSESILVDYETGLELGHYLCEQKPIAYDSSIPGFEVFHCGLHRIVSTGMDIWSFGSPSPKAWNEFIQRAGFHQGETLWVAQAGWLVSLADDLQKKDPRFVSIERKDFGHNIVLFKMTVD